MAEVIVNTDLPNTATANNNNNNMDSEAFIMSCILDFNANQNNPKTAVALALDGLKAIRDKYKNHALTLADKLDAALAELAEVKKSNEQHVAALCEKHQQKCAMYEQVFNELMMENNAKIEAEQRSKKSLRHINEQIEKVLAEMGQQEVILDIVSLINDDSDDENNGDAQDGDGDGDGSNGGDDENAQECAETETPSDGNQNNALVEQIGNDDGNAEMTVDLPPTKGDHDDGSEKENVQPPQSSEEDDMGDIEPMRKVLVRQPADVEQRPTVASLKPAPVAQPNANAVENVPIVVTKVENDPVRKQCLWCEESFIKDSSLRNHLISDHGFALSEEKKRKKKDTDQRSNEPGKFVRPIQSTKRKRSSGIGSSSSSSIVLAEHSDDTENRDAASQPDPKRKYAKLVSAPLRRSNSRLFQMADKLDAIGAVHAREKVAYEQQTAASLGNYKQKYAVYEQVFEELVNANNAKSTANWRNALGHISELIQNVLAEMSTGGKQDEATLDVISLIDNKRINIGDCSCDQNNIEAETSSLWQQNGASAELNGNGESRSAGNLNTFSAADADVNNICEQPTPAAFENFKIKRVFYEQALDELTKENIKKIAANRQNKQALRSTAERIDEALSKIISTEELEVFLSFLDIEPEEVVVSNGGGADGSQTSEAETPTHGNRNDSSADRNRNDDSDSEMTLHFPDNNGDEESVQPESSNKGAAIESLQQSPAATTMHEHENAVSDQHNSQPRKYVWPVHTTKRKRIA